MERRTSTRGPSSTRAPYLRCRRDFCCPQAARGRKAGRVGCPPRVVAAIPRTLHKNSTGSSPVVHKVSTAPSTGSLRRALTPPHGGRTVPWTKPPAQRSAARKGKARGRSVRVGGFEAPTTGRSAKPDISPSEDRSVIFGRFPAAWGAPERESAGARVGWGPPARRSPAATSRMDGSDGDLHWRTSDEGRRQGVVTRWQSRLTYAALEASKEVTPWRRPRPTRASTTA